MYEQIKKNAGIKILKDNKKQKNKQHKIIFHWLLNAVSVVPHSILSMILQAQCKDDQKLTYKKEIMGNIFNGHS